MDGTTWLQVNIDGWGDSNNGWTAWDKAITSFNNQLYVATTNWQVSGAEIWRYEPEVTANFTATPTEGIAPLEATFTNTSTGTLTANLWDFGDGATSTITNPVHIYNTAGVYTVTLTADSFGNLNTLTQTDLITVYAPVRADFTASPTDGFIPLTVTFTNTSSGTQVSDGSSLLDQFHRLLSRHPLGDQNTGPHYRSTMSSLGAVRIHHTPTLNHLERGMRPSLQEVDRDGKER